jgi:hypothetical protein
MEVFSSNEYFKFLLKIKILKDLNMLKYTKQQKLAIILNIYQTMILHSNIKLMQSDENNLGEGLVESVKSLFKKNSNYSDITYCIGGEKLSI